MDELDVTIIVPVLNEAGNIQAAINATAGAMDRANLRGEMIVIDDGSSDGTGEVVRNMMAAEPRLRMIRHETPQGVGSAFWAGAAQARGAAVCLMPGDGECIPFEILRHFVLLDSVDLVIPHPLQDHQRTLRRRMISRLYRAGIRPLFGSSPVRYTNGAVLYRRRVLDECDYHESGFFFQTDLLVRLLRKGYLYAEVPYGISVRAHGKSKALTFRSLGRVMRGFVRLGMDIYIRRKLRRLSSQTFLSGTRTAERYAERGSGKIQSPTC